MAENLASNSVLRHDVAVNPYLVVTGNGADVTAPIGGTVRSAVRAAGIGRPESILSTLTVKRHYGRRLAPVTFEPNQMEILDLRPLEEKTSVVVK